MSLIGSSDDEPNFDNRADTPYSMPEREVSHLVDDQLSEVKSRLENIEEEDGIKTPILPNSYLGIKGVEQLDQLLKKKYDEITEQDHTKKETRLRFVEARQAVQNLYEIYLDARTRFKIQEEDNE